MNDENYLVVLYLHLKYRTKNRKKPVTESLFKKFHCKPATLLKTDCEGGVFLRTFPSI